VKNIDLIIRLVKELNKRSKYIAIELLIYGEGDHNFHLKKYIHKLGCEGFVKMMGASNDKQKMYESIDALISLSSIEGLPTVILESIAFGKPVLYTDCSSGPRELMAPSTNPLNKTNSYEKTNVGYLVKPVLDVASYSDSLSSYEQEYVGILESFISDVGKQNFSMEYDASPFSEEVVVKKWLEMIGQLN
jgi:glycosyltransferase involved in cell wall biosynthesis